MPALVDTATWRTHPYSVKGFLYFLKPAIVFQARINQLSFTYPLAQFTYDTVTTGAYGNIKPGMTILFGTTAGADDLGRQRVRKNFTSTLGYIGWSSFGLNDGEVALADNIHITVINDYRVWVKTPRILDDGTIYKDFDEAIGTWGIQPPPVANAGPGLAQFVDPVTNLLTVDFDSADSFATADGATIDHVVWDFEDGTASSTTTSSVSGVTFPVGFRWVHLTAYDTNGKSHTCHVPVLAASTDPSSEYYPVKKFTVTSLTRTPEGQTFSVVLKQSLPRTNYPQGTLVMFWERERYGTSVGSLTGPTGREHMRFIGWMDTSLSDQNTTRTGVIRQVTLQFSDVAKRLAKLPSFPQTVKTSSVASSWFELKKLTLDRFIHYLLQWHTTALDVADYTWSSTGSSYLITILSSDGGTLYQQGDNKAVAYNHRLTCNSFGQLKTKPNPQLQALGDRTSTVIVGLGEADWSSQMYEGDRAAVLHWLWSEGILASETTVTPVFSVAPGKAPGQGSDQDNRGQRVALTVNAFCIEEGMYFANRNNAHGPFTISLKHAGEAGIEPAEMEWIRQTITSNTAAQRGYTFTNARFLPLEVTFTYDWQKGTKTQRVQAELETSGPPAVPYVPPTTALTNGLPNFVPDEFTVDGFLPDLEFGDYLFLAATLPNMALVSSDGNVYQTTDWDTPEGAGGPTWQAVSMGVSGTPVQFAGDPFCPKYTGSGDFVNGWVVTTTGIYYVEDLLGTPVATLQKSLRATSSKRSLDASFGSVGYAIVLTAYSDGVYETHSLDGTTWSNEALVGSATAAISKSPGVAIRQRTAGGAYGSAFFSATPDGVSISGSFGTKTAISNPDILPTLDLAADIHIPWDDNDDELLVYHGRADVGHWSHTWDFTQSDGNWQLSTVQQCIDNYAALYESGKGWKTQSGIGGSGRGGLTIRPANSLAITGLTRIKVTLQINSGNSVAGQLGMSLCCIPIGNNCNVVPSTGVTSGGLSQAGIAGGTHIATFDMLNTTSGVNGDLHDTTLQLHTFFYYGSASYITKVEMIGVGTNPFDSTGTPNANRLYRVSGTTKTDVSPSSGGIYYGPWKSRWQVTTCPVDRKKVLCAGRDYGASLEGVWLSLDAGDHWDVIQEPTSNSKRYQRGAISGDGKDVIYLFGIGGAIGVSLDYGGSVEDKSGNLTSDYPTIGEIIGIAGG